MKLSKSKLALAKVINENGGWPSDEANFAAQDKIDGESDDNTISFYSGKVKPTRLANNSMWRCENSGSHFMGYEKTISGCELIANWHQTCLSREEYYHAHPNADADGWIEWVSDDLPVERGAIIDVKYSDGDELHGAPCGEFTTDLVSIRGEPASAEAFGYGDGSFVHIIAYRLHKPEVKLELSELVAHLITEPEEILSESASSPYTPQCRCDVVDVKPTIEQLAQDYRNKLDFANRKQDEADKANMESDAALSQLEDAIAAIGFVITQLAATEKEPELVITDWRDLLVGDEVECVESNIKRDKYNGMVGRLHTIDESDTSAPYLVDFGGKEKIWCHNVKFIRRP